MNNVIKFPVVVRRCKTPTEADAIIGALNMRDVRGITAVKNNGEWVITIRYMTVMEQTVANAKREWKQ